MVDKEKIGRSQKICQLEKRLKDVHLTIQNMRTLLMIEVKM